MKALLIFLNLIAGSILIRFTISKFAAWPVSVAGFVDMAKPIGVDPTFFRIATGFIIGFAALSFFINCLIILLRKEDYSKYLLLFTFNNLYSTGAMLGALLSEFFLRSSVKWLLVYIAIGIVFITMLNLVTSYRKVTQALRNKNKM